MIRLNTTKKYQENLTLTATDRLFKRTSRLVRRLATCISTQRQPHSQFDEVETALAGLPLASEEFAIACSRLRNARNSAARGEFGAACYELRLLAGGLFASRHP